MAARRARVPPLHRRHVRRPRLTRRLDASTARIILLVAPAGYGKTSLASEWLEGRREAGWLRCTSSLADVAAFSVALAEAVGHVAPCAADRLRQRLSVPDAPESTVRALAEMLAEELADWPQTAWLAIDDYHLVMTSMAIDELMDLLLETSPLRLIATSRRRPPWATARRRLQGEVLELNAEALAMTSEEATAVLQGCSSDVIEALLARAEGWPAVIGLAAICGSDEPPQLDVASELYRYFAEEILRHELPSFQAALLRAAIPPTIDVSLCERVLGLEAPRRFLAEIVEAGLAADVEPGRVAFHPLLREFLVRRLEQADPETARSVRETALARARHERRWAEAFELARHEETSDALVTVVASAADDLLGAGQLETLESWLATCGARAERHPTTRLARAEILYRRRRLTEAEALARDIATSGGDDDPTTSRAWYLAGRAAYLRSRTAEARCLHRHAEARALTDTDLSNARWGAFLASVELEEGVEEHLARLLELESVDDLQRVRAATAGAMVALARGRAREAHESIARIAGLLAHPLDPTVMTMALIQWASIDHIRSEYLSGISLSSRALDVCNRYNIRFAEPYCWYFISLSEIGRRNIKSARNLMRLLCEITTSNHDPYIEALLRSLRIRFAVTDGDLKTALQLAQLRTPRTEQPSIRGELLGMGAVVAAALGQSDLAASMAERALEATRDAFARVLVDLSRLVVAAQVGDLQPEHVEAFFEEMFDTEYLDPLVLAYRAYPPILRPLAPGGVLPYPLELLLRRARDDGLAAKLGLLGPLASHEASPVSLLTPREAEVLELIRLGCSNREIAARLVISPATAKVHVRHVLRKLGVTSRLRAALWQPSDGQAQLGGDRDELGVCLGLNSEVGRRPSRVALRSAKQDRDERLDDGRVEL